jgi:hypothetical protein
MAQCHARQMDLAVTDSERAAGFQKSFDELSGGDLPFDHQQNG